MSKRSRRQILRLLATISFVGVAAGGRVPASARGLAVITPIGPTATRWLDRWLGMQTGGEFVLVATTRSVRVARFNQPRRFRVCITGAKSAGDGVGAKVITEDAEIVIPAGYCGEFDARQLTVVPATALDSTQQVHGYHEIVG